MPDTLTLKGRADFTVRDLAISLDPSGVSTKSQPQPITVGGSEQTVQYCEYAWQAGFDMYGSGCVDECYNRTVAGIAAAADRDLGGENSVMIYQCVADGWYAAKLQAERPGLRRYALIAGAGAAIGFVFGTVVGGFAVAAFVGAKRRKA